MNQTNIMVSDDVDFIFRSGQFFTLNCTEVDML